MKVKEENGIDHEKWSLEQEKKRKPGQKFPTPSPGFADRVFYESLHHQNPDSIMAKKWCVEHGVLPTDDALKAIKQLEKAGVKITAININVKTKKEVGRKSKGVPRKKGVIDDAVEDSGLGCSAGYEGVGTIGA